MQTTTRSTRAPAWRGRLIRLTFVAAFLLSALSVAPAHAAADSGTIARPAAARDAARGDSDRHDPQCAVADDENGFCLPSSNWEPLRELIDKYAPSAIEWSMLPHIAGHPKPVQRRREVAPA